MVEDIQDLLAVLPGVKAVLRLKKEHIPDILSAESRYASAQVVKVSNLGMHQVLERELVFLVLKNHTFRRPPLPTVYLVEDAETEAGLNVVGEEYFKDTADYQENHRILDNGMVLFPDRISTEPRREAYFLLPPIPFPELEESTLAGRLENIMSVSPSVITDDLVRRLYDLPKGTEYATLFVGADTSHG